MNNRYRWKPARLAQILCIAVLGMGLGACGGGSGTTPAPPPPVTPPVTTPPVTVPTTLSVSAASATAMVGGKAVALTAATSDGSTVSWQLASGNPGALSAATGASVDYLPPTSGVGAATQVTITASAGGASKSVVLTLSPDPDPPRLELVAGDEGGPGEIDGTGARARLLGFRAGAFDAAGNLYVTEYDGGYAIGGQNNRAVIRKITPGAVVSTVLNTPLGQVDGDRASARATGPSSIASDAGGNLYFVDGPTTSTIDSVLPVRRLDGAGNLRTIANIALKAGDSLRLSSDAGGKLYAVQSERVSVIAANGTVTTLAGVADGGGKAVDGQGLDARFVRLRGAAADGAGNLYLIDGNSVRKMTPSGLVSTVAGTATDTAATPIDGGGAAAHFKDARSIAVTATGAILVVDNVARTTLGESWLRTVTPAGVVGSVPLAAGYGDVLASATGPVLLGLAYEIDVLAADGGSTPFAGRRRDDAPPRDGTGAAARFLSPTLLDADAAGNLYLTDLTGTLPLASPHSPEPSGFYLRKITPAGVASTLVDLSLAGYPSGIAVSGGGDVYLSIRPASMGYVGGQPGGAIYKVRPGGDVVLLAGAAYNANGSYAMVDGVGAAARFVYPRLQGMDADGNLYVSDLGSADVPNPVRKVTPAGVVTTIAALPAGLKKQSDQAGNLYTADYDQHVVYQTTPAGVKTVIAGVPGQRGTLDGALPGHLLLPASLVATGPYSFALISDRAVMKLVVPH